MGRPKKIETTTEQKTVARTKKLPPKKIVTSRTGVELTECYCRKCMKMKPAMDFFEATDLFLDANGKMSICRNCCNDIYNDIFLSERNFEKALLKTCRILNVRYDETAIFAAKETLQSMLEKGLDTDKIFGMYKGKLSKTQETRINNRDLTEDFTFQELGYGLVENPMTDDDYEDAHDLKQFWGTNFEKEDYDWLEEELADWKKTHKCDTKAEETLLKEICYKEFDIRKDRAEGRDPSNKVKQLQDLMKTASVDPAKTAMAGSGKSQDTFSSFIKTIEQNEPAEYYKDKELFKDFDNIDFYFRKYVTRPLKNFITQSRDFNVEADDGEDEMMETEVFEDGDLTTPLS
jgi:hypothetical protein